jgi:hypothetical protein
MDLDMLIQFGLVSVFEGLREMEASFRFTESRGEQLSTAGHSLNALSYLIMDGRGIERSSKHSDVKTVARAVCVSLP